MCECLHALVIGVCVRQQIAVRGQESHTCPTPYDQACDILHGGGIPHLVASSRLSTGLTKSGLQDKHAATVRMGSKQPKIELNMSILPNRRSTGNRDYHRTTIRDPKHGIICQLTMCRPSAVNLPFSSTAPSSCNTDHAFSMAAICGGSIAFPRNSLFTNDGSLSPQIDEYGPPGAP
jgi:hypothetical protein